ncbi:MAG: hypothetical protein Q8J74_04415 [Candidatus Didemnitutus sp.]|nr:hypothetical protein [Candidatus Didemnitutus sp.]
MTKRAKIFAVSGILILAVAFAGRAALLRATLVEWPESPTWFARYAEASSAGPRVILGHDSEYWRVKRTIRVDVRQGIPHTRSADGMPIRDLVSYINAEIARTGVDSVVVSASREERIGGVVAVIDECRKSRVRVVVLNQYLDAFASK